MQTHRRILVVFLLLALVASLFVFAGTALAAPPERGTGCVRDGVRNLGCDEAPAPSRGLSAPTSVKIVSLDGYSGMPQATPLWSYALVGVGAVALVALATGLTRAYAVG